MLVSILARPATHRSACARMQAAPDDLNQAFASYAGEARRGGVLWEGPEPDAAFAPDEVCVCGERASESESESTRVVSVSHHLTRACQVIARTLHALRYNDEPAEHTGTATLCRFSTPGFRLAGMEHIEEPPTPQVVVLYVL